MLGRCTHRSFRWPCCPPLTVRLVMLVMPVRVGRSGRTDNPPAIGELDHQPFGQPPGGAGICFSRASIRLVNSSR